MSNTTPTIGLLMALGIPHTSFELLSGKWRSERSQRQRPQLSCSKAALGCSLNYIGQRRTPLYPALTTKVAGIGSQSKDALE